MQGLLSVAVIRNEVSGLTAELNQLNCMCTVEFQINYAENKVRVDRPPVCLLWRIMNSWCNRNKILSDIDTQKTDPDLWRFSEAICHCQGISGTKWTCELRGSILTNASDSVLWKTWTHMNAFTLGLKKWCQSLDCPCNRVFPISLRWWVSGPKTIPSLSQPANTAVKQDSAWEPGKFNVYTLLFCL